MPSKTEKAILRRVKILRKERERVALQNMGLGLEGQHKD